MIMAATPKMKKVKLYKLKHVELILSLTITTKKQTNKGN